MPPDAHPPLAPTALCIKAHSAADVWFGSFATDALGAPLGTMSALPPES
jgi:hypothetical protein